MKKQKFKNKFKVIITIVFLGFLTIAIQNVIIETNFYNKYGVSTAKETSEIVGTISIYSSPIKYPTLSRFTGHSWIYIVNNSKKNFEIAGITVPPEKGITFGTTANTSFNHKGIWFNLEGNNSYYVENISLKGDFYKEDLEYLNTYLKNHDKWNIIYNCSVFASEIWNSTYVGQDNNLLALTPIGLYNEIEKKDGYSINEEYSVFDKPMFYNVE